VATEVDPALITKDGFHVEIFAAPPGGAAGGLGPGFADESGNADVDLVRTVFEGKQCRYMYIYVSRQAVPLAHSQLSRVLPISDY
jgi:hypothetical protein